MRHCGALQKYRQRELGRGIAKLTVAMEIGVRPGCCKVCYNCKVCYKLVNARQQAFQCDPCKALVHRLFGTGFSQSKYREIVQRIRDGGFFEWQCSDCHVTLGQPQQ